MTHPAALRREDPAAAGVGFILHPSSFILSERVDATMDLTMIKAGINLTGWRIGPWDAVATDRWQPGCSLP